MSDLNFTRALASGLGGYNGTVGAWWAHKTKNGAHVRAYTNIARHVMRAAQGTRGLIIDYGCGTGVLLKRLMSLLPTRTFLGLDGSRVMLREAESWAPSTLRRASASVEFCRARLPDFSLTFPPADLVIFTFPNIASQTPRQRQFETRFPTDRKLAWQLALAQKQGKAADSLYNSLFMNRVIARNLHSLLRPGGLCVRVDYSQGARHELAQFDKVATAFEEGSLSGRQGQLQPEKFFTLRSSRYYVSAVMRDVYDQTKDVEDREGGYLLSVLQAQ